LGIKGGVTEAQRASKPASVTQTVGIKTGSAGNFVIDFFKIYGKLLSARFVKSLENSGQ
jgi:hypothetical protein